MTQRYALFLDIDGTLVSFQTHEIPPSTILALTQAKANGSRVYIATGRPPIIIDHFQDRFNDQPWLIYDAKRHYGFYYDGHAAPIHVTFEDEAGVPFDLRNGKMDADVLSDNDQLFQDLWRTYFKAICIKERMNPRKQLKDMPRRYWKYMTEKNGG